MIPLNVTLVRIEVNSCNHYSTGPIQVFHAHRWVSRYKCNLYSQYYHVLASRGVCVCVSHREVWLTFSRVPVTYHENDPELLSWEALWWVCEVLMHHRLGKMQVWQVPYKIHHGSVLDGVQICHPHNSTSLLPHSLTIRIRLSSPLTSIVRY